MVDSREAALAVLRKMLHEAYWGTEPLQESSIIAGVRGIAKLRGRGSSISSAYETQCGWKKEDKWSWKETTTEQLRQLAGVSSAESLVLTTSGWHYLTGFEITFTCGTKTQLHENNPESKFGVCLKFGARKNAEARHIRTNKEERYWQHLSGHNFHKEMSDTQRKKRENKYQ